MTQLEQVVSTLEDAETGQRGYLLTGERVYLEPYEQALSRIPGQLERLRALTGYGTDADRQKTRDAGFDLHLAKPVDPRAVDGAAGRLTPEALQRLDHQRVHLAAARRGSRRRGQPARSRTMAAWSLAGRPVRRDGRPQS